MCALRKMREGLPDECGGLQRIAKRKNGTECILCYECTKVCPKKALHGEAFQGIDLRNLILQDRQKLKNRE